MSSLKKRIFVGNLPPGTVEADIEKKFHKYGNILSIEIKQRGDSSTFAFLDLETDTEKLNACFTAVPKKPWNGHELKLEVAKESFLSRLAKERQHHTMVPQEKPAEIQKANTPTKHSKSSPHKSKVQPNDSLSKRKSKEVSSESSDSESDFESKGKLKMFRGTKNFLSSSKQDSSVEAQLHKKGKSKALTDTKSSSEFDENAEEKSSDLLQRLEMFSDLWKDGFGDTGPPKRLKQNNDSRYAEAEEKRINSVAEKRKSFQKQKEIIKMALSNVDSKRNNKKIIFSQDMDTNDYTQEAEVAPDDESTARKLNLFEDDMEEDVPDLKIKSQFEGRKGQKMLELQSRYAHDERFTLDEKFYESDNDKDSAHDDMGQEDEENEKKKQLKILENVLGHSVEPSSQKKRAKMTSMLRFDPTMPDHAKFEQKIEKKAKVVLEDPDMQPKLKKKKTEEPKPVSVPVSKDTFYKVTDTLKDALQNKSSGFSLRQMFGANEQDSNTEEYESVALKKGKKIGWTSNPFKYDSSGSDEEDEDVKQEIKTPAPVQEINMSANIDVHEKFFFSRDDPRLQEGLDFITSARKSNQSFEEFVKLRRELKQIIRSKVKKIKLKKKPFKKKLGGQKKKMKRRM